MRLETALAKLNTALEKKRSVNWCHRLWSKYIRLRDGRCLACEATANLTAHHILRKCVVPFARFETGNGVTLCRHCHRIPHSIFNKRPRQFEPLNARGGDDIDLAADLYELMARDARERGILQDARYFVSDALLEWFCAAQGFPAMPVADTRLERAIMLVRTPGLGWYEQIGVAALSSLLERDAEHSLQVFHEKMDTRVLH